MIVLLTNNGIELLAQLQLKAKNIFSATQTHEETQREEKQHIKVWQHNFKSI